jgi:hypothetical protein
MNSNKRPVTIWVLSCLYIAVGAIGFAYHLRELMALQPDSVWIELTELLAILAGAFMLRGSNWARWLALAWMAFHVAISFPAFRQVMIHSLFFAVIAWLLFRPDVWRYFRQKERTTVSGGGSAGG